jgi:hypothetical protein
MIESLCHSCQHCRAIVSGKGTTFFLCQLSQQERRYSKYPPQPIVHCQGYVPRGEKCLEERAEEITR